MALADDFKARFPDFDTTTVDKYIPILEGVYPCFYGGSYTTTCGQEIILNLLAHLIVQENQSATNTAPIKASSSQSVGSVSVTYSTPTTTITERNEWFNSTCYGARYLMLTSYNQGGYFV